MDISQKQPLWWRIFSRPAKPINPYFERFRLARRIRLSLYLVIGGLLLSGITAFPLETEVTFLSRWCTTMGNDLCQWLHTVKSGLQDTNVRFPFMAYGTDWLAFAHLLFAVLFVGALRDPIRNKWLFQFGLIACAAIIPLALIAGEVRNIPWFWRLIDCSFGLLCAGPLLYGLSATNRLELLNLEEAEYLDSIRGKS